jgi:hypothetical protein
MLIIIDTNSIVEDFWMRGPTFSILLDNIQTIPARLCIPEIVIDEVVVKYEEALSELVLAIKKKSADLERLLRRKAIHAEEIDYEKEKRIFKSYLEQRIQQCNGFIDPYPKTPHHEIARRAIAKKKPFDSKGRGYRDTLIWESVKQHSNEGTDKVFFITRDSHDFGEAPDLHNDLSGEIINTGNVRLYNSLRSFIQECILPQLKKVDEEPRQRLEKITSRILQVWLEENLIDLVNEDEGLEVIVFDLPSGIGRSRAQKVEEIQKSSIESIKESSSGELIADIKVAAKFVVDLDLDWEDYIQHSVVRKLLGPYEESFSFATLEQSEKLEIRIRLIVDYESQKIQSSELVGISGPYGSWSIE